MNKVYLMLSILFVSFQPTLFAGNEKVWATTNSQDNISVNGARDAFTSCSLISKTHEEEKLTHFYLKFKDDRDGFTTKKYLFSRKSSSESFLRNIGYGAPLLQANRDRATDNLRDSFVSTNALIEYNNEDIDRKSFTLNYEDGDLAKTKEINYSDGLSSPVRFFMAIPSAIFGADNSGNDASCIFN